MIKIKYYILRILSLLDFIIPKNKKLVIFSSFPDFSDNAFAMYIHMINKYKNNYQYIWLTSKNDSLSDYEKLIDNYNNTNIKIYPKIYKKNTLKGLLLYFRAKYVFYTHGMYPGVLIPQSHIVVNLWHGMPLKKIGYYEEDKTTKYRIARFKYTISTSKFYQNIMAKVFKVDNKNVLISGLPRNDFMFKNYPKVDDIILKNIKTTSKMIIWLPTYRSSKIGEIRQNGQSVFDNICGDDFIALNAILKEKDITFVIKPHPMEQLKIYKNFSNIKIIDNKELEILGINLYSLLKYTDLLITDYSSVFIDFLLTKKPIYFFVPDKDIYDSSRGFIYDLFEEQNIDKFILGSIEDMIKRVEDFNSLECIEFKEFEFNDIDNKFSQIIFQEIFI